MKRLTVTFASLVVAGLCATEARANSVRMFETVFNTDYVTSAIGLNGLAGGPITVTGVSGPVTQAVLFWRGPKSTGDPNVNATITIDGTPVTGTDLSGSNGSSSGGSNAAGGLGLGGLSFLGQVYAANVTGIVTGNGIYNLGRILTGGPGTDGRARLLVFFDDAKGGDNRDVVLRALSGFDPAGEGGTLSTSPTRNTLSTSPAGNTGTGGGSDGSSAFAADAVAPAVDAIPEPATLLLIASGLALARRSRRSV